MDHGLPPIGGPMKQLYFQDWQFLMPLVFIKILFGGLLKLISHILQYFTSQAVLASR